MFEIFFTAPSACNPEREHSMEYLEILLREASSKTQVQFLLRYR
jgi:hypothetical protein